MANTPPPGSSGEIIVNAGNGQYGAEVLTLSLISDLANAPLSPSPVQVLGFNAPNDGGGGFFEWVQGSNAAEDGGTCFTSNNSTGTPGPNLVINGDFSSGSTDWTVSAGSPTFSGGVVSDTTSEFWQIRQTITGLTPGITYEILGTYTLVTPNTYPGGAFVVINTEFIRTGAASPTVISVGTITAAGTSYSLALAGAGGGTFGGTGTLTNIIFREAPGGRWIRISQYPRFFAPEWFGAFGNGSTDDTTAVQNCINAAQAAATPSLYFAARGTVALCGGRSYAILGTLTINASLAQLMGNGANLDFSNQTTPGICLAVTTVNGANFDGNALSAVENLGITGDNVNLTQIGLSVQGDQITFRRGAIEHVGVACDCSFNNVYIVTWEDCILSGLIGWQQIQPGNANSGEEMVIKGGVIDAATYGINLASGNTSLTIRDLSIDACPTFINLSAGSVTAHDCHFETTHQGYFTIPIVPFNNTGISSLIELHECQFVWTGGNPAPVFCNCFPAAPFGIKMYNCQFGGGPGFAQGQLRLTTVPSVITLNPANSDTSLTLSNGNLTATSTKNATAYLGMFGSCGISGGDTNKTYFEVTFTSYNAGNTFSQAGVGIELNFNSFNIGAVCAFWWDAPTASGGGAVKITGGFTGGTTGFTNRTVPFTIGCLVDRVHNVIDFTEDGTTWIGGYSPSAGTGGIGIAVPSLERVLYPFLALGSVGDAATINFGTTSFQFSGISGANGILPWKQFFTIPGSGNVSVRHSISGNAGGPSYPPCIDANNSWNSDIAFVNGTSTTFIDAWSLTQDTAAITSRTTGTNLTITQDTAKPFLGFQDLAAAKAGNNTTAAAFGLFLECDQYTAASFQIAYAASAGSLGTCKLNLKYVTINYYGAGGVPVIGQSQLAAQLTLTPTTSYQTQTAPPGANTIAPSWVTHVLIEVDMGLMNAGTFYVGLLEAYRF